MCKSVKDINKGSDEIELASFAVAVFQLASVARSVPTAVPSPPVLPTNALAPLTNKSFQSEVRLTNVAEPVPIK
jgi:hypothetical protein